MSFKNKVVLITGGSSGIGATTAVFFAKEGASVAIVARNEDKLKSVAQKCEDFGAKTLTIRADVSKSEDAETIVNKTIEKFGNLDILVNNAGILRKVSLLDDNFLETYDEIMNTNIRGAVRMTYFAAPHIIKSKGNIVNISSIAALTNTGPKYLSYRTSKAALTHFTRCVALEMCPHGVRVNSISPGPVKTEIFDGSSINIEIIKRFTGLKRISESEEVANMILYVASDKGIGITGSDFVIDNGTMLVKQLG